MGLLSTDIQTQSRKKFFSIFWYSSLFFLTDLILYDQAEKRYGKVFNIFQKTGILSTDIQTQSRKKLFSIFWYFSFFFSTDLIWSDQVDKNMDR